MRRLLLPSLATVLFVLACGHGKSVASAPQPPLVLVHRVQSGEEGALALRGVASARSRLRLGFKQAGVVAAVLVREGDAVHPGQVLARLDDADAQAQVKAATAQRDKARRDAERAARLAGEGALPTSTRDDAQNQLQAAEAQLALAQEALSRTRLTSSVRGTVFQRIAEPGETVGSGHPVLLVDETDRVVLKVGVTDRDLRRVKEGMAVLIQPEDGTAPFAGKVSSVAPTPSPEDGLYAVEIAPTGNRCVRPGILMQVRFDGPKEKAIRIPLESLVHREDQDFVFVLEHDRVRQQAVQVEKGEGRTLLLRSGLKGGEAIVAEGAYFLRDGQTVRTEGK
jgi:RND family efflux transporter MFP subunit